MNIFSVFTLLGGLAFFLYGMTVMSSSLEKLAGGKLERGLKKVTSNPFKSLLFGMGVTIAIQSSSAMTVMLVGFVNSGIMVLRQTIGIIMGSNIGTTLTAWVLSLAGVKGDNVFMKMVNPENFSPLIALVGILLIMVAKKRKNKDIGTILIGFSILMFGMTLMSDAVSPLADMPEFSKILVAFRNPILGVLVGAIFTGIIQSSAASVGILQALSMTGNITFGMAIPVIMGQNIGTCVTALLSSIGVNKNAKRVAVVHIYFNIIGTILCLIAFYSLHAVFSFAFIDKMINPIWIAGVHSIFNIVTTAVLLPFSKQLERLACMTVKNDKVEQNNFLDERLLATPSVAIAECKNHMIQMVDMVKDSTKTAIGLITKFDDKKMEHILSNEEKIDAYEDDLGTYLLKLGGTEISDGDSREVSKILHIIGDVERIGDHALNLSKVASELYRKDLSFSKNAIVEIKNILDALNEIMEYTVSSYIENNISAAKMVEPLEEVIDVLCDELKETHVIRLRNGECALSVGFAFNDLIANVQRIADHCSNIAVCVLRVNVSSLDTHEYLHKIKDTTNGRYVDDFNRFKNKYIDVKPVDL